MSSASTWKRALPSSHTDRTLSGVRRRATRIDECECERGDCGDREEDDREPPEAGTAPARLTLRLTVRLMGLLTVPLPEARAAHELGPIALQLARGTRILLEVRGHAPREEQWRGQVAEGRVLLEAAPDRGHALGVEVPVEIHRDQLDVVHLVHVVEGDEGAARLERVEDGVAHRAEEVLVRALLRRQLRPAAPELFHRLAHGVLCRLAITVRASFRRRES